MAKTKRLPERSAETRIGPDMVRAMRQIKHSSSKIARAMQDEYIPANQTQRQFADAIKRMAEFGYKRHSDARKAVDAVGAEWVGILLKLRFVRLFRIAGTGKLSGTRIEMTPKGCQMARRVDPTWAIR
jgi:hypothetical protein